MKKSHRVLILRSALDSRAHSFWMKFSGKIQLDADYNLRWLKRMHDISKGGLQFSRGAIGNFGSAMEPYSSFEIPDGNRIRNCVYTKNFRFWRRLQEEIYAYELLKLNKNSQKCAHDQARIQEFFQGGCDGISHHRCSSLISVVGSLLPFHFLSSSLLVLLLALFACTSWCMSLVCCS